MRKSSLSFSHHEFTAARVTDIECRRQELHNLFGGDHAVFRAGLDKVAVLAEDGIEGLGLSNAQHHLLPVRIDDFGAEVVLKTLDQLAHLLHHRGTEDGKTASSFRITLCPYSSNITLLFRFGEMFIQICDNLIYLPTFHSISFNRKIFWNRS